MSIYKPSYYFAFDVDGIILDTGTEIWRLVTSHFEIPWSMDAWKEYYIEKQLGIPIERMRPIYEPVLYRRDIPLLAGAAKGLSLIYEKTKEPILLITARRPQFVDNALASIKRELPDVPFEIVNTSKAEAKLCHVEGHDKSQYLKDHGIGFFVDDNPHPWQDYLDAGISIGTLDWPWTRGPASRIKEKHFRVFKNWDDLSNFIVESVDLIKRLRELNSRVRNI